jgi:extracellular elastinolytic metalloproteinase
MRLRLTVFAAALAAFALPGTALAVGGGIHASHEGYGDLDARGAVAPTAAQREAVVALGATARWNSFGTPRSLYKHDGYLGTGLAGSPAEAARAWIEAHKALFRLSSTGPAALELVNAAPLRGSAGHAVTFRQRFGSLAAAHDGLITVGVTGGDVAYVSSSAIGDAAAPAAPTLGAVAAWVAAAGDVGRTLSVVQIGDVRTEKGWTVFRAPGFSEFQRARLVALGLPGQGVRAAWEANVVDVNRGQTLGVTSFVDGVTGAVLLRDDRVDHLEAPAAQPFSGSYTPTACGAPHEFAVAAGTTTIDVTASATVPANDIVLVLAFAGREVTHSDTATSPEAIHYQSDNLQAGTYSVLVCPYNDAQTEPLTYTGTWATSSAPVSAVVNQPRWKFFKDNPALSYASDDRRIVGCWQSAADGSPVAGCQLELQNVASRAPWDYSFRTNTSTLTTRGNNAHSAEAWAAPPAPKVGSITPAEQYSPVSPNRTYVFPWTNQWQTSQCSPGVFASPERNDIDAAATNLFAMHNRMHDWSYFLGFTERTYNLQETNFGNTAPGPYPGHEGDPEIGNVQAGGVTGGSQGSWAGRDNANQLTLQDGIAGITNMYLWQPIPGAFYAPCVDGDYDMSVIGHEYTHAISNRMIGGPDAGITGNQGRAMGESWSDLSAVEYLNELGWVSSDLPNPFTVGAYATGNKATGIRNYAMNESPLNYSDVGYDFVCNTDLVTELCSSASQAHADGEIWSATNFDVRQALVDKYDAAFPYGDADLQRRCADGQLPADQCPGNRRWVQIMFDAFLLMPGNVTMVDARDAYLAADRMRFGGANQAALWRAFAKRGLGELAADHTKAVEDGKETENDDDPVPSFESPLATDEATVTFAATAADESGAPVAARVFVGDYEARVTPIADTDAATELPAAARFVPGTYRFVVQAPGYGAQRFTLTLTAGQTLTHSVALATNWASKSKGAVATGDGVGLANLIDDTEATNWAALVRTPNVAGTQVTVDLAGDAPRAVTSVQVSALLRPRDSNDPTDPNGQNRFTALRQFEIWTCSTACTDAASFSKLYTSPEDAFPGTRPRPLAPNLLLRSFDVPDTTATHVRLVVVTNQCIGGPAYRGEQDADPASPSDCVEGSVRESDVRAAELQVFGSAPAPAPVPAPPAAGGEGGGPSGSGGGGSNGGGNDGGGRNGGGSEQPPRQQPPQPPAEQPAPEQQPAPAAASPAASPTPVVAAPVTAPAVPATGVAGQQKTIRFRSVGGWGAIAGRKQGTRAWFWFRGATGSSQKVLFDDKKTGIVFRSTKVASLRFNPATKTAVITGTGLNKGAKVRFTLTVVDRGAKGDVVRIALTNGYARSGKVLQGGLKIRTRTA